LRQVEPRADTQFFRANVGVVLANADGHVLALERSDIAGAWQLPQGGLLDFEEPIDAAYRETREETGVERLLLERVDEHPRWIAYELPPEMRSRKTGRGQVQKWFLFRFVGSDADIDVTSGSEFRAFRWMPLPELVETVATFRQSTYRELTRTFGRYLNCRRGNA
jgi:putative (di)nucleoside polyphosphate hydrolase